MIYVTNKSSDIDDLSDDKSSDKMQEHKSFCIFRSGN